MISVSHIEHGNGGKIQRSDRSSATDHPHSPAAGEPSENPRHPTGGWRWEAEWLEHHPGESKQCLEGGDWATQLDPERHHDVWELSSEDVLPGGWVRGRMAVCMYAQNALFFHTLGNLIFLSFFKPTVCQPCKANWIEFHNKCYLFYEENAPWKTWHGSRQHCQERNADLVVIDTLREQVTRESTFPWMYLKKTTCNFFIFNSRWSFSKCYITIIQVTMFFCVCVWMQPALSGGPICVNLLASTHRNSSAITPSSTMTGSMDTGWGCNKTVRCSGCGWMDELTFWGKSDLRPTSTLLHYPACC